MPENPAAIGSLRCGRGQPLLVIAGPCVMESEELTLSIATRLAEIAAELGVPLFDMQPEKHVQAAAHPHRSFLLSVREKQRSRGRWMRFAFVCSRMSKRSLTCFGRFWLFF